jgi:hypothetical protein
MKSSFSVLSSLLNSSIAFLIICHILHHISIHATMMLMVLLFAERVER